MWYHDNTFDGVYAHYRRPIWQYFLAKTKNKNVADELTQDVFLKAYRERDSFKQELPVSAWLWTIARNTVTDWFRKYSESQKLTQQCEPKVLNQIPDLGQGPEALLEANTEARNLLREVSLLPVAERKALTLRLLYQLPYQEIARCLNISVSAAKRLIQSSKDMLQREHF